MEENQSNNPTETSDKPQDTIAQKKHAAMIKRLPNLHQSCLHVNRFYESKKLIETEIKRCRLATDSESKANLKSDLEKLPILISELEKLLLPKQKFSFRNKSTAVKKHQGNAGTTVNENSGFDSVLAEKCSIQVRDSPGFGCSKEGDFTLSDLNSCEVRVTGCFRALYIHRMRNCLEQVEDCLFMMPQIFYLRVRSRPIVEDCNSARFAPYLLCYEGIDKYLEDSSLDEDTGNWANVGDFKWLRAVQSPKRSILPEEECVGVVNISNLETPSDDI
ncbi:hypothetical protein MKW92_008856 [Papaver armeniacum]|nr:hypothetical protein MKW92_008856 [Papaver armeniacum]